MVSYTHMGIKSNRDAHFCAFADGRAGEGDPKESVAKTSRELSRRLGIHVRARSKADASLIRRRAFCSG
jgi:hypothetical protein